jgi:hypothetical protein
VKPWTLREWLVIGYLIELGHKMTTQDGNGWSTCTCCGTSWWIKRRAELASDGKVNLDKEALSTQPLAFRTCDEIMNK